MKTSLKIAGVCLLVFTFTISECGLTKVLNKKQDIPADCTDINPDLLDCIDNIYDTTAVCSFKCRSEIESYFGRCFADYSGISLEELREEYDQLCGEPSTVVFDYCQPTNFNSRLEDCLISYGLINLGTTVTDSPACTCECRTEIEDYVERCFNTQTGQIYKDEYNAACGEASGGVASVDVAIVSLIPALLAAVTSAVN